MTEKRLRIHARVAPGTGTPANDARPTAVVTTAHVRRRRRRDRSDRLLQGSAYACALLLGVLALQHTDAPWAKAASDRVAQALTMRVDLDESIGALKFVKDVMPKAALVFMNIGGENGLTTPAQGAVAHPWSRLQPWVGYTCATGDGVYAAADGTAVAVSPLSDGLYGLLIDHGGGAETLYARMAEVDVKPGDAVRRGDAIGKASETLYFEYRLDGESTDPEGARLPAEGD